MSSAVSRRYRLRQYPDREYQVGCCSECGEGWAWPQGDERIADYICPSCGGQLRRASRQFQKGGGFRLVPAEGEWRELQARQQRKQDAREMLTQLTGTRWW